MTALVLNSAWIVNFTLRTSAEIRMNQRKQQKKSKEIILGFADDPEVSEMNLDLLKKKMLGQYFQSLNSIEYIANQFTQSLFGDRTLFDLPEIIDSIQMKDVLVAGEAFISEEASVSFI